MNDEKPEKMKGRKKAYIFDDSCAICGSKPVESGRIFHGLCVCEACVEYILNIPENDRIEEEREKSA